MAIKYMDLVTIPHYKAGRIDDIGYQYDTGSIIESGNGDSIIIPDNISEIAVTLYIDSGEGKVQTTTNLIIDVISGTGIIWVDWDAGSVTSTTQDSCVPVTAIRMVNTSGTTRLLVRTQ